MPLISQEENKILPYPFGRLPQGVNDEKVRFLEGFVSSLDEAFQLENTLGSVASAAIDGPLPDGEVDLEYNPLEDPDVSPFIESVSDAKRFIRAENREQALEITRRVELEKQMRSEVQANGAGGKGGPMGGWSMMKDGSASHWSSFTP